MNEIDKKIIELIEPYMCKEGDYFMFGDYVVVNGDLGIFIEDKDNKNGGFTRIIKIIYEGGFGKSRRLGAYDITAILKYIDDKGGLWNYRGGISYMEYISRDLGIFEKPLHLYGEQEKQNLYNLLVKLGDQQLD